MPRCHLTREFLKSLDGQTIERITHYSDIDLPGFLLERRTNNNATWYFRYRDRERKNRYCRIGPAGRIDILEARSIAYALYKRLQEGLDPQLNIAAMGDWMTLSEFVTQYYLPHVRLNKRSWQADESMLRNRITPQLGERSLSAIRRLDVVNWLNGLRRKGLCPGSCNRTLSLLRYIFNCAIRWDILASGSNPCTGVRHIEDHGARERYLSRDEALQLIKTLDELTSPSANAVKLLLFTGARKNEILSARWDCINFESRLLTVPISKSGKTRYIPLSDAAIKVLTGMPKQSIWLFPNQKTGNHLHSIFHFWDTLRKKLNLEDVRLHDLRHSFASFLVNAGCSLYTVQKILGHYDPKVTMRYAHLATSSLVQAANIAGTTLMKPTECKSFPFQ